LIDGGETDTGVVQYLQSIGIQRIDLVVATHPHSDHIGGLVQVLKAIPVAKVVTNGQAANTSVYEHFLDAIAAAQAEYVEVKRGDVISLGSLNFLVLSPVANTNSDTNENSVVLQFTYGRTTVLMMGDAGKNTEASLLASGLPLKANILKVGHHGSTSGSSPAFLNAVKPEVALYSAGINNSYHHPAHQTIAALNAVCAVVYGTDKDGAIIVSIDQNGYKIETQKDGNDAQPVVPLPTNTQSAPAPGALEIVSITSPIPAGGNASLTAKTTPGASCSITVYYKSGPSKAQGLEPKTADGNGAVAWSWKVGIKTTPGAWKIVVTCNGLSQEIPFTVQ
jgi:beta-lactamase superfamily II metal-dependent hydrolase